MARKVSYEQALGTDRGISFDPLDGEIIEKLLKKDIREGEERLMLALLADAIEHFQKHVLSKDEKEKKLFQEAEQWFLEKDNDGFSPLSISARRYSYVLIAYVKACCHGRKQGARNVLLRGIVQAAPSQ